ncbi:hypothetical protein QT973_11115 [Microcoleus sp. Z1_A1]|uniref:hypothetical protein n=1 Tax=Microcoleus sp. Z1_A1 TaxID=3055428 RepID=UPI002FD657A7
MKAVFEPEILFISESDWQDSEKRDTFLKHLLDNLENINNYQITRVYWTDDLEELLWDHPQLPPWRQDRDWKLQIVPIIYKAFNTARKFIQSPENLSSCLMQPVLNCSCFEGLALCSFLELMHIVIEREENVYLCLGVNRIREEFTFLCDCHSFQVNPVVIAKPIEWLDHIDLTESYWPSNIDEEGKFNTALEIAFKKLDKQPIYEYEFSKSFLKDIIKVQNHRTSIIEWTAKRLTLTKQEAARDPHLQDEYLKQKKEYRFRITQRPSSTRIHYKYVNNKIKFLRYYDEGEHDDGL